MLIIYFKMIFVMFVIFAHTEELAKYHFTNSTHKRFKQWVHMYAFAYDTWILTHMMLFKKAQN